MRLGNALHLPLGSFTEEAPLRVIANLPYNIATKLLTDWLSEIAQMHESPALSARNMVLDFTLLFQDEVAHRITAEAGAVHYGRLSVLCGWLAECRRLFTVPAGAFTPPPKVRSTLVRLVPRARPLAPARRTALEAVTRAAFGARRKTLRRALARMPCGAEPMLEAAGLSGGERAEEVSIEAFCAMARLLDGYD